ncbi:MAG: CrcB family protein, partial [Kiloniellales bacterium]
AAGNPGYNAAGLERGTWSEANMRIALAVAGGGALGAVARFLMAGGFPFATLAVNLLGCFAMGAFIEATALVWSPSPELRAMIVVGLLGGFTTFSTYSMEVVALVERGAPVPAAVYTNGP